MKTCVQLRIASHVIRYYSESIQSYYILSIFWFTVKQINNEHLNFSLRYAGCLRCQITSYLPEFSVG